jgi:hypothetical protein
VIRSGVYIGMGGPDVDERAFNQLRQMRAEHGDLTLEEFKRMLREHFLALILYPEGALPRFQTCCRMPKPEKTRWW